MNSGFDIIRRNKVIGSNDKRWRPDSKDSEEFDIFGSGHSNAKSRLFGELIFHNFGSDVNKSQIDWGVAGEWVKANFLEYLYKLIKSESSFQSNFNLKNSSSQKILDLVKLNGCNKYISGLGGKNYLKQEEFLKNKIKIIFYKSEIDYSQGNINFFSGLSILDLLFNYGIEQSIKMLYKKNLNKKLNLES